MTSWAISIFATHYGRLDRYRVHTIILSLAALAISTMFFPLISHDRLYVLKVFIESSLYL